MEESGNVNEQMIGGATRCLALHADPISVLCPARGVGEGMESRGSCARACVDSWDGTCTHPDLEVGSRAAGRVPLRDMGTCAAGWLVTYAAVPLLGSPPHRPRSQSATARAATGTAQ